MPFVNELIPEAEKSRIGTIKGPAHQPVSLYKWTVDRERDVFLMWTGRDRDEPRHTYFVFGWKGNIFKIEIFQSIDASDPGGEIYTYRLHRADIPEALRTERPQIVTALKEALQTFSGFYGTTKTKAVNFEF